jgi:hypothetical protein
MAGKTRKLSRNVLEVPEADFSRGITAGFAGYLGVVRHGLLPFDRCRSTGSLRINAAARCPELITSSEETHRA